MVSEQEIVQSLQKEGFSVILPWYAQPGEVDFEHARKTHSVQVILEGEITFFVEGLEKTLRAGERYAIESRLAHAAITGPECCYYIFALQ